MKKGLNVIFTAIFFGICAAPLIGNLLGYKNINAEKRVLAPAPAVFTKEGFNTDFPKEFDDFFSDNFAFRPDFVTAYASLNAALFGESISDQVIIGKEGWLFFEPELNDYMKVATLSDNAVRRLAETLEIERDYTQSKGVGFIFAVAPDKSSICGQYMPDRYKALGSSNNAENLYRKLAGDGFDYLDLHSVLCGGDMQLYHKLDTHWNNAGALKGYNALLGRIKELKPGFTFNAHEELVPVLERTWRGDLSEMLYPAAGILDYQYVYDIEKKYTTEKPLKSLEDLTIKTRSESGFLDLVMFRDSFANALIPMMSNEFASVAYSRAVPYDYRLINGDTDIVILEIAERNLPMMLDRAPIIPAPEVNLSGNISPADMDIRLQTEDKGDYVKIAGVVLLPGYISDKDYDIYIRLNSGSGTFTFKPFPILEKDWFEAYAGNDNAAFSMIIDKGSLPGNNYIIEVLVSDGSQLHVDSAGTVIDPGR